MVGPTHRVVNVRWFDEYIADSIEIECTNRGEVFEVRGIDFYPGKATSEPIETMPVAIYCPYCGAKLVLRIVRWVDVEEEGASKSIDLISFEEAVRSDPKLRELVENVEMISNRNVRQTARSTINLLKESKLVKLREGVYLAIRDNEAFLARINPRSACYVSIRHIDTAKRLFGTKIVREALEALARLGL